VDGPRAWVGHLLDRARGDAGRRRHGQAGISATRPAGRARRGAGARDLGREPQVRQELADDLGILDGGEQAHAAATARAGEDVEVEGAPHEVGPRPVAGSPGGSRELAAGRALLKRRRRPGGTSAARRHCRGWEHREARPPWVARWGLWLTTARLGPGRPRPGGASVREGRGLRGSGRD
jgi:hypothetical protein